MDDCRLRNDTIALDRVERILQDATSSEASKQGYALAWDDFSDGVSDPMEASDPDVTHKVRVLSPSKRLAAMRTKCTEFFEATSVGNENWESLDELWSRQMQCNFRDSAEVVSNGENVGKTAHDLIQRLPKTSLPLPDYTTCPSNLLDSPLTASWENLQVASRIDTNIVRLALATKAAQAGFLKFPEFINTAAELLEVASSLAAKAQQISQHRRWLVVRGFLWSSWERAVMLWFHNQLAFSLFPDDLGNHRYRPDNLDQAFLRATFPTPALSTQRYSQQVSGIGKAQYMCSWALQLLRSEPACITCDFRLLHERYSALFGDRHARCIAGSEHACQGSTPDRCQRFKGMKGVQPQSAHDPS